MPCLQLYEGFDKGRSTAIAQVGKRSGGCQVEAQAGRLDGEGARAAGGEVVLRSRLPSSALAAWALASAARVHDAAMIQFVPDMALPRFNGHHTRCDRSFTSMNGCDHSGRVRWSRLPQVMRWWLTVPDQTAGGARYGFLRGRQRGKYIWQGKCPHSVRISPVARQLRR